MLDSALSLVESYGYIGTFFLMFVEMILPPIPSEAIMPFVGFAAYQGKLNIWLAILIGTFGSIAGSAVLYWLGAKIGEKRIESFIISHGRRLGVTHSSFRKADAWFDSHAFVTVLICRVLPGLRSVVSLPAGMRGMPLASFMTATALGSFVWTLLLAMGGYVLGDQYYRIKDNVELLSEIISIGLIVGAAALVVYLLKKKQARRTTTNHVLLPLASRLVIIGGMLLVLAGLAYPGSSSSDMLSSTYGLWVNTISDLGMTQSYRGETLTWSRYFFTAAVLSFGFGIGLFLRSNLFSQIGKGMAALTALLFILIPFFPSDIANPPHNQLFFAAVISLWLCFGLMVIQRSLNHVILLFTLLSGYILFIVLNPNLGFSHDIRTIHIIAQKLVLSIIAAWVVLQPLRGETDLGKSE